MARTNSISLSLFSVLLVISVLWKPIYSDDSCDIGCKGSASGPSFLSGHKYNYGVEGSVAVYLTGADKQETTVRVLSQVSVTAVGNCVHELKVQNLAISGPSGKKYSSPVGVEKPIRFTIQDGRIGPDICSEPDDTRRSLNIKRAIISLLQTDQKSSTFVDVFGACPTDVSASKEGSSMLVHQTRDLSRCAHREQGKNDLMTAIYNPTAEIKDTQVLQSIMNIESKVNSGVPEKVAATEEYLYRPFSVGDNGARARVLTKLTLTGKSAGAAEGAHCTQRRTIIFENPHGVPTPNNAEAALNAVKDTAKTLTTEAGSQSAGLFVQLIRIFRSTNNDDLKKVYNQVKGNQLQRRVFLDGLLRTGTGDSIEASIDILKAKELSTLEASLVYLSLGNAKHVDDEAVKAAVGLLDISNAPKEIYLGVGALAGAYCREHNCHDGKAVGVKALSQKLAAKLNCKAKSKVEEDKMVAVLKGIRSIRHLEDAIIDKLVHCAVDKDVKARVKVAALEAFHADPCSNKIHKAAMDIMKNRQLDSEIRIKGYLAVIECPCAKSATEIKNMLENEPIHQVGRFITTSLRYIRSSANPDKRNARQHYGQIRTPNKFNVDDRKYSFYREASFNVDALGIGGNTEETVIYSQDSFIPRSATFNLTTELFGHSLNVFEIGARQGNLDRVLERFFGPGSDLRTKDAQDLYDDFMKRWDESSHKVQDGLSRGRRSVKTDVDNMHKNIKGESNSFHNELDLDIYLKLFGTDAVFLSLGDDKGMDFNKMIDQALKFANEGINKAKHFQQDIRAHLLFLDAELTYPTSAGFPLKLALIGSATGRLDVATNFDLRQIFKNPESAKVDIKLIPSMNVELIGAFVVDADAVVTGLKVNTNLHSSTGTHIIAKVLENGRGFDLQLGLPIEKQEILTASNDLVFITADKGQRSKIDPVKVETDRKEGQFCFDQMKGVIGQTICGEFSVPFSVSGPEAQASLSKFVARFPLTGPAKIKLTLVKDNLRGYHIKGVFRNDNNGERRGFELLFDAEGSQNRRTQLSGELINNKEEKTIKMGLESPLKTVTGQVSLYTKPNEYVLMMKGKHDAQEYYGRVGFNVQGNEKRSVFKPVAEYQLPDDHGKQALKIDGQLIKEINGPATKYSLQGIKVNMPNSNEIIDINGHYSHEPKGMEIDVKAKKGEHNLVLSGSFKNNDLKLLFTNTLNPFINFKANGHFQFDKDTTHNSLDLYYNGDLRDNNNRVSFNQMWKSVQENKEKYSIITKNKLEIFAVPFKVEADAEIDPKKIEVVLDGLYMDKKGDFKLESRNHIKKAGDYSLKLVANADKQGIQVFSKRDIVNNDKSNLENIVEIKGFGKYELSGVVLHKRKPNDVNIGAVGQLKIAAGDKKESINFDIVLVNNNKLYSSHAKIATSKGQFLDYLLKVTKGPNANGQMKLNLKDTISADGQFKVTDNDGRGNGMIIVDFKKSQRKIKGDVKFVIKDPIINADVDVFLNFEKDNNDKVHFSTNTKNTDAITESKNKLVYAGKKTEVNIHKSGKIAFDGKLNSEIEIVLPTERVLSWKLDRQMEFKDQVLNGQASMILSDAPKRGAAASTISVKAKALNCDIDKDTIHYENQIDIKLKDGRNLQNNLVIKMAPEGDKVKQDFKADVTGNLIPKPIHLVASNYYTNPDSIDGASNYRLKASYGSDMGFELVGKEDIKVVEKGDKKYMEENTLSLRLPFEKAHDIKAVSNILFLVPQGKNVIAEFTIVESLQVNADVYKIDTTGKLGVKEGFGKLKFMVPHVDPVVLDANYKVDFEGERKSGKVEMKANYGKGKSIAALMDASTNSQEHTMNVKINAPQNEKLKKLDFNIVTKNPTPDSFGANIIADMDGKVYKSDWQIVYSKAHPLFDVKSTCPETGEVSRIYLKGTAVSSSSGKFEMKIVKIYGFDIDSASEMNVQKDNIALKLQADSQKLGWKNLKVDISSKDAGSGKRLEVAATNDNKNLMSGSTSYISKQEGQKTIIEGSGSVKLREEQKSANFKYIRTLLTEGNEQGVETFLNLALGERSYVAESRVTNLEYKTSYVYCEEKKQCAHADFNSKINMNQPGVMQHLINVGFDLRKLGFAPEFGLQINNEVSEKKLPQYSLDLHVNKEAKKYHLHVYSQPEQGKFPAGITIVLPQRTLALESIVSYPVNKAIPFPIKGEIVMHLDKNKPQMKTAARFMVDMSGDEKHHNGVAEFGFSHPKLGKEAVVKVTGSVNVPTKDSIKIETAAKLSFPSLGNDRESKILLEASPVLVKLFINTPVAEIIDLEGKTTLKDSLQQADLKFSLLQGKTVSMRALAKDFQYFEFTSSYSDQADRKLSIIAHLEPEKRMDISADVILPEQKKNIAHGALFLENNYIKSDYGVSKENFKYFMSALKDGLSNLGGRIKQLGEKSSSEFKNAMNRVEPSLKNLEKAYADELQKLVQEMSNDQSLKEVSQALSDVTQSLAKMIDDFITVTKPLVDSIWKTISETSKKVLELYEKQIEPQVKEFYTNISALVQEYMDGLIEVAAHFAALVADFFEKHKAELQELTNTLAEIFKDLTRMVVVQLKEFREKSSQLFTDMIQQIKELPIFEFLKEKWDSVTVSEQVMGVLSEIHNTIRNVLPTNEIKQFSDALYDYTQKKLSKGKVDDAKELRVLYEKFAVALTSSIQWLRTQINQVGLPNMMNFNPSLPLISGFQSGTPGFGGYMSFSFINQLIQGDILDPLKEFNAYRPRDWDIVNELPPSLRGVVVNGQHIFTFSGRHLTFPGNCRYILSHDYVDGNFTIYMQLQNGAPKAIGMIDRLGSTIEIKDNGQVQKDGQATTLPIYGEASFAFQLANGRRGIAVKNSAIVFCTPKLEGCWVRVNGFYHGKIRGLLGVGNNEPYDDFKLPNGKIASSESEFGNAYKLSSSCAQVKTPEHHHNQHHMKMPTECEMVFGGTSPLRPLALVLDVTPFRQACIHAVASNPSDGLNQACLLAEGYVSLAVTGMLPAAMPSVCLKCTDADTPKNIGDVYNMKLPGKQADIVVTIEESYSNVDVYSNLVVPLVSEIVDELKAKKITDIKVYLLGVTSKYPFLDYYDTDLKLKTRKPRFNAPSRYEKTKIIRTNNPQVDGYQQIIADYIDELKIQFGVHNIVGGYQRAQDLPLRPGAVKHNLNLVGEKCHSSIAFIAETMRALVQHSLPGAETHTHSMITVTPDLTIGGGKNAQQVVGFTNEAVWLLGDKKVTKESETLRPTLSFAPDSCISYIEASDGLLLTQSKYMSLPGDQQKAFVKTAATAITSQMLETNVQQTCTCMYHDSWSARSVCVANDVKETARRRK